MHIFFFSTVYFTLSPVIFPSLTLPFCRLLPLTFHYFSLTQVSFVFSLSLSRSFHASRTFSYLGYFYFSNTFHSFTPPHPLKLYSSTPITHRSWYFHSCLLLQFLFLYVYSSFTLLQAIHFIFPSFRKTSIKPSRFMRILFDSHHHHHHHQPFTFLRCTSLLQSSVLTVLSVDKP